jgi:hypothetical protein
MEVYGKSTFGKFLSCPPLAKGDQGGFYKIMLHYNEMKVKDRRIQRLG